MQLHNGADHFGNRDKTRHSLTWL